MEGSTVLLVLPQLWRGVVTQPDQVGASSGLSFRWRRRLGRLVVGVFGGPLAHELWEVGGGAVCR